jgi:hypothetical protein
MFRSVARRLWPLLVVGGLLGVVAILATVSTPGVHQLPVPNTVKHAIAPPTKPVTSITPYSTPTGGTAGALRTTLPLWVITTMEWTCGLAVALVVAYLIWLVVRSWLESATRRPGTSSSGAGTLTRREAVLAAVDASIAELAREDGDARSAVIACWVRLEDVAEAAGTIREPGDTPSELVTRLLGDHQVSAGVLTSLADLYRTARYSALPIQTSMRDQARSALIQLRAELHRSRSGPLAEDGEFVSPVQEAGR